MQDLDSISEVHSIGALARLGGCSVDTIRYYERAGLMPAATRSDGGQRRYGEREARQLLFIRRLRDLGFSLDEVGGFLGMVRQPSYGCAAFKEVAETRLAAIRRKILELRQLAGRIEMLTDRCAAADADCSVLDTLWGDGISGGPAGCCGGPAADASGKRRPRP